MVFLCILPNWIDFSHLANARDMKSFKHVNIGVVKRTFEVEKIISPCTTKVAVTVKTKIEMLMHGMNWQWRLNLALMNRNQFSLFICFLGLFKCALSLSSLKNWSYVSIIFFFSVGVYLLFVEAPSSQCCYY